MEPFAALAPALGASLPPQTGPDQEELFLGGRRFVLTAMGEDALLDWAELQVLAAVEKAKAVVLEPHPDKLRESLRRLLMADVILVTKATGCDVDFYWSLSVGERLLAVETQDRLNRMHKIAPALQTNQLLAHVLKEATVGIG